MNFKNGFNKQAGFLDAAGRVLKSSVTSKGAVRNIKRGAGLGAAGGAVSGALQKDEDGNRGGLGGAIKGAIGGGALGAAGGVVGNAAGRVSKLYGINKARNMPGKPANPILLPKPSPMNTVPKQRPDITPEYSKIAMMLKEAAKRRRSNISAPTAGRSLSDQLAAAKAKKDANPNLKTEKRFKKLPKKTRDLYNEAKALSDKAQKGIDDIKASRRAAVTAEAKAAGKALAPKSGFAKHWPKAAGGAIAAGAAAYGYHKYKQKKESA